MKAMMETSERVVVENELNELMQITLKLEYELYSLVNADKQ
ncbi:hypothetical protein ACFLZJ_01810 [Nanoarchaeota archaeon]